MKSGTRVTVYLLPTTAPKGKRVIGRLAQAYHGVGPVFLTSGGNTTVVPAARVHYVEERGTSTE